MASGGGKATASSWVAAMSVGAGTVKALKERRAGLCCWNYHALPCVQQRAGSAAAWNGACGKGKVAPAAGGTAVRRRKARQEQEDELRTVMYLSNWGPNN